MRQVLAVAVAAAIAYYHGLLLNGDEGGLARRYLRSRGFDGDAARQFQVGWSPDDWDRLSVHLQQQKFSRDDIVGAGLAFVNPDAATYAPMQQMPRTIKIPTAYALS